MIYYMFYLKLPLFCIISFIFWFCNLFRFLYDLRIMRVICFILWWFWWFTAWMSRKGFVDICYINCVIWYGILVNLQIEFYWMFGKISSVRNFLISLFYIGLQVSIFQMDLGISMSCRFLGGVLRNRGPLKGKRRLPRIRTLGQGVIILLVSELTIFKSSF